MKITGSHTLTICFVIVGSCLLIWTLTENWMEDGQKPIADGTNEYAIILGAKVNGETPSLSLRYRLEAALDYANQFPDVKFILSGGQGPDEAISEAEAMRRYLVENGVDEKRLQLEDSSTSTYENLLNSKKLLPREVRQATIITSDYHLARARKIAESLDLKTDAVKAKTPKIVEVKLKNRERLALLKTFITGK